MEEFRERMAKIEGAFEQVNYRFAEMREDMNHRFTDVNRRFGMLQWEIRIWFFILLIIMSIYHFV